jgi:hypothetical protein
MLHIFTFASNENYLQNLKQNENVYNNNINYIIVDRWNGFPDKLKYMKTAIQNIPLDDIVCFIDGYDVLLNSDNETIISQFKSYNCDFLIGAEINCYPECYKTDMDSINTNTVSNYKYINSGGYIGYNKNIQHMLNWKTDIEINNICDNGGDQGYLMFYYLNNFKNKNILVEQCCKVFQNLHSVFWDDIIFKNGVVCNTIMNTTPCILHFNGGAYISNTNENIIPIFIKKMEESKLHMTQLNLNGYTQMAVPRAQI